MIISITRGEGPSHQCGKQHLFETFKKANSKLWDMSLTAPKEGGYDKCDFRITNEATGFDYRGTYDLKHHSVEAPDLQRHIIGYLRFYGGTACPSHMTDEQYRAFIDTTPERLQEYLQAAEWVEAQP